MSEIPKEHQLKCEGCGEVLDMRDISVLSHGWIEDGEIVCFLENELGLSYTSSRKVGEPVEWTKDKQPVYLN
jgi:hypothetical protein